MSRIIVLLAFLSFGVSALAQDNFPDVPESHVALKDVFALRALGFVDFTAGFNTRPLNLAGTVIKGVDDLPKTLRGLLEAVRKTPGSLTLTDEQVALMTSEWRRFFRDAISHLEPEIVKAGRDPAQLRRLVDASQPLADQVVAEWTRHEQFRDVPADHWAAKAVLELKEAGILSGYPDRGYGG